MRDFYQADQGEPDTIPSFATRIEGLLSLIRDRFPDQLPHQEEQRLLKNHLFHGSRKCIRDSVKYCFADASLDYLHFLEECKKLEEEGKAGQAKAAPKAKVAAATVPFTKQDELTKHLRYQQHQIDALVEQVKNLVSFVRATQASSSVARPGNPSFWRGVLGGRPKSHGEGAHGEGAYSLRLRIYSPAYSQKSPARTGGFQDIQTQSVLVMWRDGVFEA